MAAAYQIRYLANNAIDKVKWDACVGTASNSLLYAFSFYLDTMAKTWNALVLNDYEAVMPLPCRKKAGFNYLFQPSITPILGIFGNAISTELVDHFLQHIPSSFKLWDISLNHFNPLPSSIPYPAFKRNNFVLALNRPYEQTREAYHNNIKRAINKAMKKGCLVEKDVPLDDIIGICKKEFPRFTHVEPGLFENLETVYRHYARQAQTYCVSTAAGKKLASCAFLFSGNRAYYWLVGNDPESRDYGASALLVDTFIRDYNQQGLVLDFEGSDDKGVADFYKKFGAVAEPFTSIYYNRLPFPFNLFKRPPAAYRSPAF